jgi:hypothetical protein
MSSAGNTFKLELQVNHPSFAPNLNAARASLSDWSRCEIGCSFLSDAVQQDGGGLVGRIVLNEAAFKCLPEDGLTQTIGSCPSFFDFAQHVEGV